MGKFPDDAKRFANMLSSVCPDIKTKLLIEDGQFVVLQTDHPSHTTLSTEGAR